MKKNLLIGFLCIVIVFSIVYIVFLPISKYAQRSMRPFTLEELEYGLNCSFDMSSSIFVGTSSDSYHRVYGILRGYKISKHNFTVSLDREANTLLLTDPSVEKGTYGYETEYVITSDSDELFRAISEKTDNKYEQYLFLSRDGQFRHIKISYVEGSEMGISRGTCTTK